MVGSLYLTTSDTSYIANTKLQGNGLSPVVKINGNGDASDTTKIIGFSITGGYPGIYAGPEPTLVIVSHCNVYENIGYGIDIAGGVPYLLENTKFNNNIDAGVYLLRTSGTIKNCEISDNTGSGIGYYDEHFSNTMYIINTVIRGNTVNAAWFRYRNPITIINCTISDNTQGIYSFEGTQLTIKNSIIFNTGTPILLDNSGVHVLDIDYSIIESGEDGLDNQTQSSQ